MTTTVRLLVDEARRLVDLAADNARSVAVRLADGRATIDDLLAAVDVYRAADRELALLLGLRRAAADRRRYRAVLRSRCIA